MTPVFIIGVPRSGTTLLRVLLDSHSQVAALPESPWLLGAYGEDTSLRGLLRGLIDGPFGIVANVSGVTADHVFQAGRRFLDALFDPVLASRGKPILAFKTPHDIRHLEFLIRLVPDARFIHITRDGRDVCASQIAKKGRFFRDLKEFGRLNYANAFRRWVDWELRARTALDRLGVRVIHVRYEDLATDPAGVLRQVTEFLGVPFEPTMVDYASAMHDYPRWEAGSTDVAGFDRVSAASIGKWRNSRLTVEMQYTLAKYDRFLIELGYPSSNLSLGLGQRAVLTVFPLVKAPIDLFWSAAVRLRRRAAALRNLLWSPNGGNVVEAASTKS